jgi:hypothetical protein
MDAAVAEGKQGLNSVKLASKSPARLLLACAALVASVICAGNASTSYASLSTAAGGGLCAPAPNDITWTTATEVNTAGFNLYRGGKIEGPYTKINAELIPAGRDPLTGGKYQFEDAEVVAGRTYFYQLEDVEFGGGSTRHGPIVVTAQSTLWLCDYPLIALGLTMGALVVVASAVFLARRGRRSRRTDSTGNLTEKLS